MNIDPTLVALARAITNCLLPDGYKFPADLAATIALTPAGAEVMQSAVDAASGLDDADIKAVALARFSARNSLLIDSARTNTQAVLKSLGREIQEKRIRFPWVIGQELDQLFAEQYGEAAGISSLPSSQAYPLLDSVPQGVFQIHRLIVGPYGALVGKSARSFQPITCGPTFVCGRLECGVGHHVTLRTGQTDSGTLYSHVGAKFPSSIEMTNSITDAILPDSNHYSLFNTDTLPWLLGNGLTPSEQRELLKALALKVGPTHLTEQLESGLQNRGTLARKVGSLSAAEAFQLLLTFSDEELIFHLESLVDDQTIKLESTEVRTPISQRHANGGAYSIRHHLTRNGVSFRGSRSTTILRAILHAVYAEEDQQHELRFLLRHVQGETAFAKLDQFLRTASQGEVLDQLVFVSRGALLRTFRELKFGRFVVPDEAGEEEALMKERVLWKLGGTLKPPAAPEQELLHFVERIRSSEFAESSKRSDWATPARSAGLDVYVELEGLLSRVVDFSCWMLLSDHYGTPDERFYFSRKKAKEVTSSLLSSECDFEYQADGKNSLGAIVEALFKVADAVDKTLSDPAMWKRAELPTYARYPSGQVFPFLHTRLACDLDSQSAHHLVATLRNAGSELGRGKVVEVRNRLGHSPASFPSYSEICTAVDSVVNAVSLLSEAGLCATIFTLTSSASDAADRTVKRYKDGLGRLIELWSPSPIMATKIPTGEQLVVARGAIANGTIEPVRFSLQEDTAFASYWHGYRNRRANVPEAH